jgi:putative ABC transport system permease protein
VIKKPGFTATAVLVTALGVGANTTVFSVTDRVLIRPLPFDDSERLVTLWENVPGYRRMEPSPPNYLDWKRLTTSFESMAALASASMNLVGQGEPQRIEGASVTPELLPMLGVGRSSAASSRTTSRTARCALRYGLCRPRPGGAADVLGRSVRLNDASATVIGVLPKHFSFPNAETRLWTPLALTASESDQDRDNNYLNVFARLRAGVSLEEARAEMKVVAEQLERAYRKENEKTGANVVLLRDQLSAQSRLLLLALFAASACVLLIACSNLAGLLLARAVQRRRELAPGRAGADANAARQLLTEPGAVLLGGCLGVLAALGAPQAAQSAGDAAARPRGVPRPSRARVRGPVPVTGIGFGVALALRAVAAPTRALREGPRARLGGQGAPRSRWSAEVIAALVLVVSSGLLIRTLWRRAIHLLPRGRRADAAHGAAAAALRGRGAAASALRRRDLGGPRAAGRLASRVHRSSADGHARRDLAGGGRRQPCRPARRTDRQPALRDPGVLRTFGIPPEDALGEATRNTLFRSSKRRSRSATGRVGILSERFRWRSRSAPWSASATSRCAGRWQPSRAHPHRQVPTAGRSAAPGDLRSIVLEPASLLASVRRIVKKADLSCRSPTFERSEILDVDSGPRPRSACSRPSLAVAAADATGIHGLLYAVSERIPELGLRLALGAPRSSVLKLVLGDSVRLVAAGGILGLLLAYAAGRAMEALLFGVTPVDLASYAAGAFIVAAMTLTGSLAPALRALRVDPTIALRAGT